MMHIEEGDKHNFWADGLPAGLTVVRQFDKLVMAAWVLCLIAYAAAFVLLRSYYDMDSYFLLSFIGVPFDLVGLIYIINRKNIASLVITVILSIGGYFVTNSLMYVIVVAYVFIGAMGVACVVDAIQRIIFYDVVSHIRYVNVKEKLSIKDRLVAFIFNVPPDLDTRNITICPKKLGNKFPWKDMGSTIVLSLIVGMFFWIYLSLNPTFMETGHISSDVPTFIFGVMLYVPVIVLPFTVFKSLDVKIGTNYRDFRLFNGALATIQRMAVPVFAALIFVLMAMNKQDPLQVLLFIGFSTIIILFVVILTSIIYYYAMEATTSSDISKKWKIFIPVPLMMTLHKEDGTEKEVYPGTPERDESDMSEISLTVRVKE